MNRILLCTDGSSYSQVCCEYAAWLCKQSGASVDALYVSDLRQFEVPIVADLSGSLGIQPYEAMVGQLQEMEKHKAKFIEESTLGLFADAGLEERITFHHETGLLVDVIGDYEKKADLILLGKRGENADFAKHHLGSMLERVVRSVAKPCLVTSRKFKALENVAIAYDGGESCRKAIQFMAKTELFKALDLHVITVAENRQEDVAAARLKEAEKAMRESGLTVVCQALEGEVESAIADYVDRAKVDLLIAGAYGHSRIRDFLIGSTTTELLRSCRIPVLCFR